MPALKCMIALDRSSSYCKCSQGGITDKADMLKKVAPVIPSLNTFYISGCKSHAWWYSTVLTGLYLLLLHHNNDEQKEWVRANIFRYADLPPHAGGFMWLIVALKHKSESDDVEKNILFHECFITVCLCSDLRGSPARGVAAEWFPAVNLTFSCSS